MSKGEHHDSQSSVFHFAKVQVKLKIQKKSINTFQLKPFQLQKLNWHRVIV